MCEWRREVEEKKEGEREREGEREAEKINLDKLLQQLISVVLTSYNMMSLIRQK